MKLRVILFGFFLLSCLVFSSSTLAIYTPGTIDNNQTQYIPGEIIVKYKSNRSPQELTTMIFEKQKRSKTIWGKIRNLSQDLGDRLGGQGTPEENLKNLQNLDKKWGITEKSKVFEEEGKNILGATTPDPFANYYLLKAQDLDVTLAAGEFSQNPSVQFAEPNYIFHILATPNDPYYSQLWGLAKINAPAAWDIFTGSDSIVVAVIDTGINYNHEDFDLSLIIKGRNFISDNDDPLDDNGHGTHVSGTIGAIGNNDKGIVGVNWRVKIMAIKALNSQGEGSLTTIAQGIRYAADYQNPKVRVISMSLGGLGSCDGMMNDTLSYAASKDITIIAAAGNDNQDVSYYYLASNTNVIAVAATTQNDQKSAIHPSYTPSKCLSLTPVIFGHSRTKCFTISSALA
jgi:hypothetical protein